MDLLKSKKFQTTFAALAMMYAQQYGDQPAPWYVVVSGAAVACLYLIAQGLADSGKERTKLILDAVKKGIIDAETATKIEADPKG